MKPYDVGVFIGSLRREAASRKLADQLALIAPPSMKLREIHYGDAPLYNADMEAELPAQWARLRADVVACDALIFVTPEYNRSLPGGLKNAIDVASRPTGKSSWPGKPALIVAQSAGPLGGLAGSHALRQTLAGVNVATMPHPEVYLSRIATLFDAENKLVPETQEFLRGVLASFETWVARFAKT